jgi:hypothetical protein
MRIRLGLLFLLMAGAVALLGCGGTSAGPESTNGTSGGYPPPTGGNPPVTP